MMRLLMSDQLFPAEIANCGNGYRSILSILLDAMSHTYKVAL